MLPFFVTVLRGPSGPFSINQRLNHRGKGSTFTIENHLRLTSEDWTPDKSNLKSEVLQWLCWGGFKMLQKKNGKMKIFFVSLKIRDQTFGCFRKFPLNQPTNHWNLEGANTSSLPYHMGIRTICCCGLGVVRYWSVQWLGPLRVIPMGEATGESYGTWVG